MKNQKNILLFTIIGLMLLLSITLEANQKIKVSINKKVLPVIVAGVKVNGEKIDLPIPAIVTEQRIVVPVRFLAEELGAKVDWENKEQKVTIRHGQHRIEMFIDQNYIFIDGKEAKIDAGSIPRLVLFDTGEIRTMIPLRVIGEALGYQVGYEPETLTGTLVASAGSSDNSGLSTAIKDDSPGTIEKADVLVYYGKMVLYLQGLSGAKINSFQLTEPNRVIFDLEDTVFAEGKWEFELFDYKNIKKIRIAQFQGQKEGEKKITRVVFEVNQITDLKDIVYQFLDDSLQFDLQSIEAMASGESSFPQNPEGSSTEDNEGKKGLGVTPEKSPEENRNSQPSPQLEKPSEETAAPTFPIDSLYQDAFLQRYYQAKKPALSEPLPENQYVHILIDPGHGGRDPGAISIHHRKEKEFALASSLKLRDDLKKMGYTVFMTREEDVYPTLMERAQMANTLKADIFISMHANSVDPNRGPNGIEVWYSGTSKVADYQKLEKRLARLAQNHLIKATGASDRGIKIAKHVVTKNSKMAAILVEGGFLSNPIEEALLNEDHYQGVVARAVALAVDDYVKENRSLMADSKNAMIAAEPNFPLLPPKENSRVKYRVNADVLRIRQNPGLSETVVGKVLENEVLTVEYGVEEIKKDGYTWLYVTNVSEHLSGWLVKEFLIEIP